ncbi:MAG: regulatory protein RecX [Eubacteriales bacterium]|nr:regulatory protein RecX [Eubacteriales bacterium]
MSDVVTAIETLRGVVTITFDGAEPLRMPRAAFREAPLAVGQAVDVEEYKQNLLLSQYPQALEYAVSLLALRARSEGELRTRMLAKHYLDEAVDLALYKLRKEKLLNDEAFARDWAAARTRHQLGKRRISMELRQKGISAEMADQALDSVNEDEQTEQAMRLALKLLRRRAEDADERDVMRKAVQAMQRRGFGYDEAKNALQTALERLENEED